MTTLTTTATRPRQALGDVPVIAQDTIDTPLGPMRALATAKGLAGLLFGADRHHQGEVDAPRDPGNPHLRAARRWLAAYWSGREPGPGDMTFDLHGSAFQRAVWAALMEIPFGRTWTYGEVTARVGHGAMPRATGHAIGRNPVAVIVPCHRVIGADGSLTGYAGGLPLKERLLQHEGMLLV
jgi:methylated-DNA-[protein]-cysteine S-methyltransferase